MDILDTINMFKRIKRTGIVDTVKGVREPDANTPKVSADELRTKLLSFKGASYPFEIVPGEGGKDGDIVARWQIKDAKWWSAFHAAHANHVTEIHMVLDESSHEVRGKDKYVQVTWTGNIPKVGGFLNTKKPEFKTEGARQPVGHGPDPLNPNRERQYMLDTNELKELVGEIVNRAGWTFRQVYRKKTLVGA